MVRILGIRFPIILLRLIGCVAILLAMILVVTELSALAPGMYSPEQTEQNQTAKLAFLLAIVTVIGGLMGVIFVALYKSGWTESESKQ